MVVRRMRGGSMCRKGRGEDDEGVAEEMGMEGSWK